MNTKQGFAGIIAGIIIALAIVGGAGYMVWKSKSQPVAPMDNNDQEDWKIYKNSQYGFEFKYPEGWFFEEGGVGIPLFVKVFGQKRKDGTDQPVDMFYVGFKNQNQNSGGNDRDSGWEIGFGSVPWRTVDFKDSAFEVIMQALTPESQQIEETILSTLRFTNQDNVSRRTPAGGIKFSSPVFDDVWKIGETHKITWTPLKLKAETNIWLFDEQGNEVGIVACLKGDKNYVWSEVDWDTYHLRDFCGAALYQHPVVKKSGKYSLKILELNKDILAESDIFSISLAGAVSVSADITKDWKTYTSEQYGFEFRYPADWKVTDNSSLLNPGYSAVNKEVVVCSPNLECVYLGNNLGDPNLSLNKGRKLPNSSDLMKTANLISESIKNF